MSLEGVTHFLTIKHGDESILGLAAQSLQWRLKRVCPGFNNNEEMTVQWTRVTKQRGLLVYRTNSTSPTIFIKILTASCMLKNGIPDQCWKLSKCE